MPAPIKRKSSMLLPKPVAEPPQRLKALLARMNNLTHGSAYCACLWSLMQLCHRNPPNQRHLCQLVQVPFLDGPISLNGVPGLLMDYDVPVPHSEGEYETSQLTLLFSYLQRVKEQYFCWVIYHNAELNVLNVKMMQREEVKNHKELFNPNTNLIGIFVKSDSKGQTKTHIRAQAQTHQTRSKSTNKIVLRSLSTNKLILSCNKGKSRSYLKIQPSPKGSKELSRSSGANFKRSRSIVATHGDKKDRLDMTSTNVSWAATTHEKRPTRLAKHRKGAIPGFRK